MTQPNPGDGGNAAPNANQNQQPPPAPATEPAATPPNDQPTAEDLASQKLLADLLGDAGQLGDAGKRALSAERERAEAAEKQLAELKPLADMFAQLRKSAVPDADKTDAERLQEQLDKLQQETTAERRQRWLLEVIQEKGLTRDDAEWLKGDTREELEASADKLATRLAASPQANGQNAAGAPPGTPGVPRPDPTQGARGSGVDLQTQIEDAMKKGDVKASIALKQQLAAQARGNQ